MTLRNHRFLRAYTPVTPSILPPPAAPSPCPRIETPKFTSPSTERKNSEEAFHPSAVASGPVAPEASPPPAQDTLPQMFADDTVPSCGPVGIPPPGLPTSIVLDTPVLAPQPSPRQVPRMRSSRARHHLNAKSLKPAYGWILESVNLCSVIASRTGGMQDSTDGH